MADIRLTFICFKDDSNVKVRNFKAKKYKNIKAMFACIKMRVTTLYLLKNLIMRKFFIYYESVCSNVVSCSNQ
jgi:hypothetical protein